MKVAELIKELDRVFSVFIRKSNADENGISKCITCSKRVHWKEIHCGHYIKRGVYITRWDEKNCGPQCENCNVFKDGEEEVFARKINEKHGDGTAESIKNKRHFSYKIDRIELEEKIKHYKSLI